MNTESNAMPEYPLGSRETTPAVTSAILPLYWSVRRELWENRAIYLAPLAAAALFLFGFLIHMIRVRSGIQGPWPLDLAQQHDFLDKGYELSGALIMGTGFIVGFFYTLDALYGERRDRSILFWKSLPVSDLTTVMSKVTIPLVILPLLTFAVTIVTQFLMLLLGSTILLGSGVNLATWWTQSSFFHVSLGLLYHILTVHGLWYAPFYGWLLLVSAWAPRAPFLWASLPPFVICGVEKIAFNTSHFLTILQYRAIGPDDLSAPHTGPHDFVASLIPHHFFSTPGLWTGLALAAAFLFAAVRLRRYQGPI